MGFGGDDLEPDLPGSRGGGGTTVGLFKLLFSQHQQTGKGPFEWQENLFLLPISGVFFSHRFPPSVPPFSLALSLLA